MKTHTPDLVLFRHPFDVDTSRKVGGFADLIFYRPDVPSSLKRSEAHAYAEGLSSTLLAALRLANHDGGKIIFTLPKKVLVPEVLSLDWATNIPIENICVRGEHRDLEVRFSVYGADRLSTDLLDMDSHITTQDVAAYVIQLTNMNRPAGNPATVLDLNFGSTNGDTLIAARLKGSDAIGFDSRTSVHTRFSKRLIKLPPQKVVVTFGDGEELRTAVAIGMNQGDLIKEFKTTRTVLLQALDVFGIDPHFKRGRPKLDTPTDVDDSVQVDAAKVAELDLKPKPKPKPKAKDKAKAKAGKAPKKAAKPKSKPKAEKKSPAKKKAAPKPKAKPKADSAPVPSEDTELDPSTEGLPLSVRKSMAKKAARKNAADQKRKLQSKDAAA